MLNLFLSIWKPMLIGYFAIGFVIVIPIAIVAWRRSRTSGRMRTRTEKILFFPYWTFIYIFWLPYFLKLLGEKDN